VWEGEAGVGSVGPRAVEHLGQRLAEVGLELGAGLVDVGHADLHYELLDRERAGRADLGERPVVAEREVVGDERVRADFARAVEHLDPGVRLHERQQLVVGELEGEVRAARQVDGVLRGNGGGAQARRGEDR
jgi:hypothetical protein